MIRIERLLEQIETLENMLTTRMQLIENANIYSLCYQIETIHQKVSLAEKRCQVKNECSYIASVPTTFLIQ